MERHACCPVNAGVLLPHVGQEGVDVERCAVEIMFDSNNHQLNYRDTAAS